MTNEVIDSVATTHHDINDLLHLGSLEKSTSENLSNTTHPAASCDRSPYLVERLLQTNEKNLFNHVKFQFVKDELIRSNINQPTILDIGCGLQVASRYLRSFGLEFNYLGVDYEASFNPDAIIDLLDLNKTALKQQLPWQPDALLMLDVLEHLHEDPEELVKILGRIHGLCGPQSMLILTLPQMYRLDRFKLPHLHYPEHKIRLTQREWIAIVERHFTITKVRGFGVLSVIPYLPMASRKYLPDNRLGKLFNYLRSTVFEWPAFKPLDYWLSKAVCRIPWINTWTNDIMIVARPKQKSVHNDTV